MKNLGTLVYISVSLVFVTMKWASANLVEELRDTYIPLVSVKKISEKTDESSRTCKVYSVVLAGIDPVTKGQRDVQVSFYQAQNSKKIQASMVIVPPISGVNFLDQHNAQGFCERGLNTAIVETWENKAQPGISFDIHDKDMLRGIAAIRNGVDFLIQQTDGPVGILGTSQGAIFSSLILAVDHRVQVGSLIVGGGSIADIIADSDLEGAILLRDARMSAYGIDTVENYHKLLDANVKYNGLKIVGESLKEPTILMFIGTCDLTVPAKAQLDLWKAWGKQEKVSIPERHIGTVVTTNLFYHRKIMKFFTSHLKEKLATALKASAPEAGARSKVVQ